MPRAKFQVLIIPYRIDANGQTQYLLFKRSDTDDWQWIAGGGENEETPEQAACRELFEESNIYNATDLIRLDSVASIPAIHFADFHFWGNDVYVVPEYAFGIEIKNEEIYLSKEHRDCVWLDYEKAQKHLKWDSNKTALWELHSRVTGKYAELGG